MQRYRSNLSARYNGAVHRDIVIHFLCKFYGTYVILYYENKASLREITTSNSFSFLYTVRVTRQLNQ